MENISPLSDSLVDVTLREGSQQPDDLRGVSVEEKLSILKAIAAVGIKELELTAFAPGEWYGDADELASGCEPFAQQMEILGLYFNIRGAERLRSYSHLKQVGVFHTAATTPYRIKNYNQPDLENTSGRLLKLHQWLQSHGMSLDVLVLSTSFGEKSQELSVSEGLEFISSILKVCEEVGVKLSQLSLADTEGRATPETLHQMVRELKSTYPDLRYVAHLHPKPTIAEEMVLAGIEAGVDGWEGAWAGVGGSPFADGPCGNLDIFSLIRAYKRKNIDLGLNESAIVNLVNILSPTLRKKRDIRH